MNVSKCISTSVVLLVASAVAGASAAEFGSHYEPVGVDPTEGVEATDAIEAAATCTAMGCSLAHTCKACPGGLICDDRQGSAHCVTSNAFHKCGAGTKFCNSACGVCIVSSATCGTNSCDKKSTACGGAKCASGTKCDASKVCVPD